jgi:outer membrane protein
MKRTSFIVVSVVVMAMVLPVSWAEAADKTGFVNVQKVMLISNAGKKAAEDYKMAFEKNKKVIQGRASELKKLYDEIEKERSTLKEDVVKERELAYQKRLRDYELLVKDYDEELQRKDRELSSKLIPEIIKVVQSIGDKEKYTMIIDLNAIPIAYHTEENELTTRVIEEFNKTYEPSK